MMWSYIFAHLNGFIYYFHYACHIITTSLRTTAHWYT